MPHQQSQAPKHLAIVFFDGTCPLCHTWVRWFLRRPEGRPLYFAPIGGETAEKLLPVRWREQGETVVLREETGRIYTYSSAIFESLAYLRPPWSYLRILRFMPIGLRDRLYRLLARFRYRIFGRYETSRLPELVEKSRLLP